MEKIKVAIVGCGRISASHFKAIEESEGYILNSICDLDSIKLAEVKRKYSVPAFESISEMLAKSKPDLVTLCTPSGMHASQTIEASEAGCNILSEKPMATRYGAAIAAVEACEKNKVKLYVVKQNRLNSTIRLLKQSIDMGRFGKIYSITSNVFWTRPQSYYDQAKWRGTWDLDGGALMNQASHYADLLTYLGGHLESVFAYSATLARRIEAEDSIVLALKWRNGALGSLNVSMLTWPENLEGSLTILGEHGTVKIGGMALNKIESWQFRTPIPEIDDQTKDASYETKSVYGFGHSAYYQELYKSLCGLPSNAVTGREGLVSLQTLVGAYRSVVKNKPISFPLDI